MRPHVIISILLSFFSLFLRFCLCLLIGHLQAESNDHVWKIGHWFKFLTLISRLGLCCSWLGHLLGSYHGSEQTIYHFFPQMSWLMPITVSAGITVLVILGLQPSSVLKSIFHILFAIFYGSFLLLSSHAMWTHASSSLTVDFSFIEKAPIGMVLFMVSFIIDVRGKRVPEKANLNAQVWLSLLSVGIINVLNEKATCNGLDTCLIQFYGWYEPLYLALSISCLGLCLPDLFVAVSDLFKTSSQLNEMIMASMSKISFQPTFVVGFTCTYLVYFCHPATLIMISGTSLLLEFSIESIYTINSLISNSSVLRSSEQEHEYVKLGSAHVENNETDSDSCSDIDIIVEEYLSQIHIVSGMNLATATYLKSVSYIFKMLLATLTICSWLVSLTIQSKLYILGFSLAAGTCILIGILQWASIRHTRMLGKPPPRVLHRAFIYSTNVFLLGFLPTSIWLYIILWLIKGAVLTLIAIVLKKLEKQTQRHMLSIRESPPVFETSCTNNTIKKPKIIHA